MSLNVYCSAPRIVVKDIAVKTVVVTGASSGIGREIALAFGRQGARVAVHYRSDEDGAKEVDAAIRDSGGGPRSLVVT